ncbi:hypothetical protein Taro_024355 [Colocasia esculenta]|uniref:Uncharacterized protein n=1 Tax=Colocasia esculenta TaxID=4460 RepID=A0A843VK30_COLES|nr:hypothetical protein [Colocasia esculenta]
MLRSEHPLNLPLKVDFSNLKVDSPVLLPKLHSLVFDSDAGSHAFDMFAKQMGRMSAKQGRMPSFLRFIFREYHSGRISSQVLGPLISECERLSPSAWETLYKESHLQLQAINSSLFRQNKPILSAEAFLDLNSINPIQEIYVQWAARYTAFYALKKDLLDQKIFYPISLDRFLLRASVGKSTYFKFILNKDQYGEFLDQQQQLYIQRMIPAMGSSFSVTPKVESHHPVTEEVAQPAGRQPCWIFGRPMTQRWQIAMRRALPSQSWIRKPRLRQWEGRGRDRCTALGIAQILLQCCPYMRVQSLLYPTQVHLLRCPTVVETTSEPSSGNNYRCSCRCTLAPWSSSW